MYGSTVDHLNGGAAKIAVVGLGYVGLPLAVAFGVLYETLGFDIDQNRIVELQAGLDRTLEVEPSELTASGRLSFASDLEALKTCNLFVVTVPTPINASKQPDMGALLSASRTVGGALKRGDVVIYESTVYPGATEEDCVPVLERMSGLKFNEDFTVGYSPERANPGDRRHRLSTIVKVTSGSTPTTADFVDALYRSVVSVGTHRASSIKVAEAAKVIENTQRDLNIALINELAVIFSKLGIDTLEVLEAAGTKWNFLPFRPGLVGGHCISVDPYYLTHRSEKAGYLPQVILAGRRINDGMGAFIATGLIKRMLRSGIYALYSRILILGIAFKENCPDIRNSRVVDIVTELKEYGVTVDVSDPWVDAAEVEHEYGLKLVKDPEVGAYDGIVLAVAHDTFREWGPEAIRRFGKAKNVLYDVKGALPAGSADLRL